MGPVVSIHQPGYLPWLGYFERIARSDIHVYFDDVQFEKNSYNNRNKIKTARGWAWLTVPVFTKGKFGQNLLWDVEIDNKIPWPRKHWNALVGSYSKAPYFKQHAGFFEALYAKPWTKLLELNYAVIDYLITAFGIKTRFVKSSEIGAEGVKAGLVLNICKKLGASKYLSGMLGRDYLDPLEFERSGIGLEFQDYRHPQYPQLFGSFEPSMAAVDLLFNCGQESLTILMGREGGRNEN